MHKHYFALLLLGIAVVTVLIAGFRLVGSPVLQRAVRFDQTRITDFSTIRYRIESYYQDKKKLPSSLSELTGVLATKDPETNKEYSYGILSPTTYKLCTDFSTDSEEVAKKSNSYQSRYYPYTDTNKHKKGFDCIEYEIPDYILESQNKPTPTKTVYSYKIITDETDCKNRRGIWENNKCRFETCIDSDNTMQKPDESRFIKGSVTFGPSLATDSCQGNYVYEYQCVDETATKPGNYVLAVANNCPNGCRDGACITP